LPLADATRTIRHNLIGPNHNCNVPDPDGRKWLVERSLCGTVKVKRISRKHGCPWGWPIIVAQSDKRQGQERPAHSIYSSLHW